MSGGVGEEDGVEEHLSVAAVRPYLLSQSGGTPLGTDTYTHR